MKRTAALILALALAVPALTLPAYAVTTEDGPASVNFTEGTGPNIVDPTTLTNVGADFTKISTLDIDFGSHAASGSVQTYQSTVSGAAGKKYLGVAVENSKPAEIWTLQVEIAPFYLMSGASQDPTKENLKNFTLKLIPDTTTPGAKVTNRGDQAFPAFNPTGITVAAVGANAGSKPILTSNATNNTGICGLNWSGELMVPGGSVVHIGDSQATMTWTLSITP